MKLYSALLLYLSSLTCALSKEAKFELVEEWTVWKDNHGKNYESEKVELERHIVWLSNKEYIDQHNANAHIFGFTLALNNMGDMVSEHICIKIGNHRSYICRRILSI